MDGSPVFGLEGDHKDCVYKETEREWSISECDPVNSLRILKIDRTVRPRVKKESAIVIN